MREVKKYLEIRKLLPWTKKKKKEPSWWCIMWYRRICGLISPLCIKCVKSRQSSRVHSWFCSWIKHHDFSISQDSDFMHQQHGSVFLARVVDRGELANNEEVLVACTRARTCVCECVCVCDGVWICVHVCARPWPLLAAYFLNHFPNSERALRRTDSPGTHGQENFVQIRTSHAWFSTRLVWAWCSTRSFWLSPGFEIGLSKKSEL